MAGGKNIPMRIVKERTGLTSRQIRYYDQVGLIFPERTRGNQRLFSEGDIQRLLKIKSLLDEGYTVEVVKQKLTPPTPIPVKGSTGLQTLQDRRKYIKGELSSLYPDSRDTNLRKHKRSKE